MSKCQIYGVNLFNPGFPSISHSQYKYSGLGGGRQERTLETKTIECLFQIILSNTCQKSSKRFSSQGGK